MEATHTPKVTQFLPAPYQFLIGYGLPWDWYRRAWVPGTMNPGCSRASGEVQETEPPGYFRREHTESPSLTLLQSRPALPLSFRSKGNQTMIVMKFGGSSVE